MLIWIRNIYIWMAYFVAALENDKWDKILDWAKPYGIWPLFCILFIIFGVPCIGSWIREVGNWSNQRLIAKNKHTQAMKKLDNQISGTDTRKAKGE